MTGVLIFVMTIVKCKWSV